MKKWLKGFGKGVGILICIFIPLSLIEVVLFKKNSAVYEVSNFDLILSYVVVFGTQLKFKTRKIWILPSLIFGSAMVPFIMADREVKPALK